MVDLRAGPSGPLYPISSDEVGNRSSVAGATVTDALNNLLVGVGPDQVEIFYVGKHGADTNDGKKIELAKLTIGAAIAAVNAAGPSTTNRFAIVVLDGGTYTESFLVPSWTTLFGPNARIVGNVDLHSGNTNANVKVDEIEANSGTDAVVLGDNATLVARRVIATGSIHGVGSAGVGKQFARCEYVSTSSGDVFHNTAGAGEFCVECQEATTTSGTIFNSNGGSGNVSDVRIGRATAPSGIGVRNTFIVPPIGGKVTLYAGRFNCATRWNITGGDHNFTFGELGAGSEIFTGGTLQVSVAGELRDSSGPDLTIGSIPDGQYLKRSGTSIVGGVPVGALDQQRVIYVGKAGNDGNDGKAIEKPKLTIANAIAQAVTDGATTLNPFIVYIIDAGNYSESPTVQTGVWVVGPGATITGTVTLQGVSGVDVRVITASSGQCVLNSATVGYIRAQQILGTAGAAGIRNTGSNLRVQAQWIEAAVGNALELTGSGSVDLTADTLTNSSSGNVILDQTIATAQTNIVASRINAPTGTGIAKSNAGALHITASHYICATRWNLTSGTTRLMLGELAAGSETSSVGLQLTLAGEIRETGGPTDLTIGAIADGEYLQRSGTTIAGAIGVSLAEQLYVPVRKASAGTIPAFTPVYAVSYNVGGWVEVEAADAAGGGTMPAIGMANTSITNAATVNLTNTGTLGNLDTSAPGYSVGDPLYVASGGGLTNSRPTGATVLVQKVGEVLRVNAVNGEVLVIGAGRTNDVPNIANGFIWEGNASGVATAVNPAGRYAPATHATAHEPGGSDTMAVDAAAATGSLRTVSQGGALSACADNDARLSDARTPTAHASTHEPGGGDLMAVDAAIATGSLRTIGQGAATSACSDTDSRLSDARTPTGAAGGDLGGSYPNPTVDDGADSTAIHDNIASEISAITEKVTPVSADLLIIEDSAAANAKKKVQVGNLPTGAAAVERFEFFADQFDVPSNSDWASDDVASRAADSNNASLTVAMFDDGPAEEGVGFIIEIPTGFTTMVIKYRVRAETAPGSSETVKWNLYTREIQDNTAVGSWSAAIQLADSSIPTNENFQYDQDSRSLATWGLTAGRTYQFEMTRDTADSGDTLSGDADLLSIIVELT